MRTMRQNKAAAAIVDGNTPSGSVSRDPCVNLMEKSAMIAALLGGKSGALIGESSKQRQMLL